MTVGEVPIRTLYLSSSSLKLSTSEFKWCMEDESRGASAGFVTNVNLGFVLLLIVIKVPKLLLSFPPFDHTARARHSKKQLNIPIPAMPIGVVIPSFANILDALNNSFVNLRLGR